MLSDYTQTLSPFLKRAQRCLRDRADEALIGSTSAKPAAVLVPVVERPRGLNILLTQRSDELPTHAGQIAFPGGKIDAGDTSPLDAALRETFEETGIERRFVEPVGYLDTFETGTGFCIVPVVGVVSHGFELVPEPGEVTDIFEVPLAFLMEPRNHIHKNVMWKGKMRSFYEMPYEGRYIWGVTAAMLRNMSLKMNDG